MTISHEDLELEFHYLLNEIEIRIGNYIFWGGDVLKEIDAIAYDLDLSIYISSFCEAHNLVEILIDGEWYYTNEQ